MRFLTEKVMNFMLIMKENGGKITRSQQRMYGSIAYYIMIRYLKDNGMVVTDGFAENNQKIWKFTEKGEKFTGLLIELRGVLNGKGESDNIE